jgi:hypothetical protein
METTQALPPAEPSQDTGHGETMIIAFIMAMPGWDVAMCMAAPLHRCFTLALGRPVIAFPNLDGILIQLGTRDAQRDLKLVHAELVALNFLPLAHVGWMDDGEWRCFHGSADTVSDFTRRLHTAANQMESQTQIVEGYRRAIHGFTDLGT